MMIRRRWQRDAGYKRMKTDRNHSNRQWLRNVIKLDFFREKRLLDPHGNYLRKWWRAFEIDSSTEKFSLSRIQGISQLIRSSRVFTILLHFNTNHRERLSCEMRSDWTKDPISWDNRWLQRKIEIFVSSSPFAVIAVEFGRLKSFRTYKNIHASLSFLIRHHTTSSWVKKVIQPKIWAPTDKHHLEVSSSNPRMKTGLTLISIFHFLWPKNES